MNAETLYKNTIVDYSRNLKHLIRNDQLGLRDVGYNSVCGDRVEISLELSQCNNLISRVSFAAEACILCKASAHLMAESMENQPFGKFEEQFETLKNLLNGKFPEKISSLTCFREVRKYPVRKSCVLLPWETLFKIISFHLRKFDADSIERCN